MPAIANDARTSPSRLGDTLWGRFGSVFKRMQYVSGFPAEAWGFGWLLALGSFAL